MQLAQVESKNLLNREDVRIALLYDLKGNFVVSHWHHFVSDELLFKLKLCGALRVQSQETSGKEHTIFEVTLDLSLDGVTDKSLLLLVCDHNTEKVTRPILVYG